VQVKNIESDVLVTVLPKYRHQGKKSVLRQHLGSKIFILAASQGDCTAAISFCTAALEGISKFVFSTRETDIVTFGSGKI